MTKVFITGGSGFIGSNLAKILVKNNFEVYLYDAFVQYTIPINQITRSYYDDRLSDIYDDITLIRGDVRDTEYLRKTIFDIKPNYIVHLANMPIADLSNKNTEEAISSIFNSTINLLNISLDLDSVKRFIYASSSMIYGNFEYSPCDESHKREPIDIYGGAKLASENIIETYNRRFGIEYTIIRPSAVYGPTDVNRRVSQIFLENAIKGIPISLHNGGKSKLDFTYVEDTAMGFFLSIIKEEAKNNIFNITAGEGRSLLEFSNILKNYFPNLTVDLKDVETHRPERGSLDISKAKKILGYNPKFNLDDGLKIYIDYVLGKFQNLK